MINKRMKNNGLQHLNIIHHFQFFRKYRKANIFCGVVILRRSASGSLYLIRLHIFKSVTCCSDDD